MFRLVARVCLMMVTGATVFPPPANPRTCSSLPSATGDQRVVRKSGAI
jgi:hypothetical protein